MLKETIELEEVIRQEYGGNKAAFSGGLVKGDEVDTVYIRLERDGEEPTTILLRPDELASIAWIATGILWSQEMLRLGYVAEEEKK